MRKSRNQYERNQSFMTSYHEQCERAGVQPVTLHVRHSQEPIAPTDVILRKESGSIVALVNYLLRPAELLRNRAKLAAHVCWFSGTDDSVRQITVNISDGNFPSVARYKFSVTSSLQTPVPDAHFFRDHGYAETDKFAVDQALAWDDRRDDIIWRGGLNGDGLFSLDPATIDTPGVKQRLRMALKCKTLDVDFKFIFYKYQGFGDVLRSEGLIGEYVPTHDWGGMKYAIDIDGFTNAWCNLMQRLKLGCCVLKVDSPFGYYQWYYHKLVPWEHFVPIRADLSDLQEKIDWVRTHQAKAREIASQGQALGKSLTFESERQFAISTIEEREQNT